MNNLLNQFRRGEPVEVRYFGKSDIDKILRQEFVPEFTFNALGIPQKTAGSEWSNRKNAGALLVLVHVKAPENRQKISRILHDLISQAKLSRRQVDTATAR